MKPVLLGLAFLLLFPTLQAQSAKAISMPVIPDVVMDKFILLYPDASDIVWKEQNGKYMAEFKNGKAYTAAMIKADGKVLQTKTEIKIIALPVEATSFLIEDVKVKKIEAASIIEDEPGIISFTAKADNEEYWFDGNGKLVGSHEIASAPRHN